MNIVVCGYMARLPSAGNLLAYFQYVLGLHRLGHTVAYVEESGWPYSSYDLATGQWVVHPTAGLRAVRDLVATHCPAVPVIWVDRERGVVDGASAAELRDLLASADLLLNAGGVCWLDDFRLAKRRALVDMDPLFTQVGGFASRVLNDYEVRFSYGTRIGQPDSGIPTLGLDWLPTLPPIVLDLWASDARPSDGAPYTTIANWSAYGGIDHEGEHFGQKDEEFVKLLDLPMLVSASLELALSGGEDVADLFRAHGWRIRDAGEISATVEAYIGYVTSSRGEISAAKNAYVKTNSGWFSDRTASYLAAGRPAVVQDTGIRGALPVGHGLLTFRSAREAANAIEEISSNLDAHAEAARALARTALGHDVVLPLLLERAIGVAA